MMKFTKRGRFKLKFKPVWGRADLAVATLVLDEEDKPVSDVLCQPTTNTDEEQVRFGENALIFFRFRQKEGKPTNIKFNILAKPTVTGRYRVLFITEFVSPGNTIQPPVTLQEGDDENGVRKFFYPTPFVIQSDKDFKKSKKKLEKWLKTEIEMMKDEETLKWHTPQEQEKFQELKNLLEAVKPEIEKNPTARAAYDQILLIMKSCIRAYENPENEALIQRLQKIPKKRVLENIQQLLTLMR